MLEWLQQMISKYLPIIAGIAVVKIIMGLIAFVVAMVYVIFIFKVMRFRR